MKFYVLTIFPELIDNIMNESIMGRAREKGLIDLKVLNIRDYTNDKHLKTDDYCYGGGMGMLMTPQPIFDTYKAVLSDLNNKDISDITDSDVIDLDNKDIVRPHLIYTSPKGRVFTQEVVKELARCNDEDKAIAILCGHYEGIDERIIELLKPDEISIGDYVLTGGELPSCIMMDAIARLIPGVLNKEESHMDESFENNTLEYPQYTRPEEFMGLRVPEVLLSGDHKKVDDWRREQSLIKTKEVRPDLLDK